MGEGTLNRAENTGKANFLCALRVTLCALCVEKPPRLNDQGVEIIARLPTAFTLTSVALLGT